MRHIRFMLLSCGLGGASASLADLQGGENLFRKYCVSFHGSDAKGGGPTAATLSTRADGLTRIAARRDGVWPMLEIMSIIDRNSKQQTSRYDMPIIPENIDGASIDFDTGYGLTRSVPERLVPSVS